MGLTCCGDNINGYKIIEKNIGKCSNGEIHKAFKKGTFYAMKVIKCEEEQINKRIKNDIDILKSFDHYNIVDYIDSFESDNSKYIIMELCESDLRTFIEKKRNNNQLFNEKVIFIILKDVCYGLKEIHSNNIIYKDLKTENILISSDKKFKIADFCISKYNNQDLTHNVCIQRYAPEVFDEKTDLESLGSIICELYSAESPSEDKNYNINHKINENYFQNLKNLIDLVGNQNKRINLTKIITEINTLESQSETNNDNLDKLSQDILNRKKENEIKLEVEIGADDIKKDIYFLDGETHKNLKELNENNTELYIYYINKNKKKKLLKKFSKYNVFETERNYKVLLKFKENLSDSSYMFYKCLNLKNIDLTFFDTTNIINMSHMFAYNKLKNIDLSTFKTIKVEKMDYLFAYCENLEQIDLTSFDTSNVKDMSFMFKGCKNIKYINLSSFKTIKVEKMDYLFAYCENLEQIDLTSFDTSNVKDMSFMFKGCKNIKYINLSSFNTKKVKDMSYMFEGCVNVENIDLSSCEISEDIKIDNIFGGCKNLLQKGIESFLKNWVIEKRIFKDCPKVMHIPGTKDTTIFNN